MLSNFLHALTAAAMVMLASTGTALAQLSSAPKSTGPSGGQVMGDFMAWMENHQGAAIALIAVIVLTVGYVIWGFLKPKAEVDGK